MTSVARSIAKRTLIGPLVQPGRPARVPSSAAFARLADMVLRIFTIAKPREPPAILPCG